MKLHAETKIEIFLGFSNCKLKRTTMHSTEMKTSMAIYNGEEGKNTYSPKLGVKLVAGIVGVRPPTV